MKWTAKRRAAGRRRLRALFVVFHVLAVLVLSLPSGNSLADKGRWQTQRTRREFALWAKRLQDVGLDTDEARLEKRLWSLSQRYLRVQQALSAPFEPYQRLGGMAQGWGMFRSPQRRPGQLRVEIFDKHRWITVYVSRSDEHTYLREQLDHNRMRKLVGRSVRDKRIFDELADWIGQQLAGDFPHARRARVSLMRFNSLAAKERALGRKPQQQLQHRRAIDLEALR